MTVGLTLRDCAAPPAMKVTKRVAKLIDCRPRHTSGRVQGRAALQDGCVQDITDGDRRCAQLALSLKTCLRSRQDADFVRGC